MAYDDECDCPECRAERGEDLPAGVPDEFGIAVVPAPEEKPEDDMSLDHRLRFAAINFATQANLPRIDKRFDPMVTVQLAYQFLEIIESGLKATLQPPHRGTVH